MGRDTDRFFWRLKIRFALYLENEIMQIFHANALYLENEIMSYT